MCKKRDEGSRCDDTGIEDTSTLPVGSKLGTSEHGTTRKDKERIRELKRKSTEELEPSATRNATRHHVEARGI